MIYYLKLSSNFVTKKTIILLFSLIYYSNVFSQASPDSVISKINSLNTYTEKIEYYESLASKLIFNDPEKSLEYLNLSYKLAQKNNDFAAQANISIKIGEVYYDLGKYKEALNYDLKAYRYYEKIDNKRGIAIALNELGTMYDILGQTQKAIEHLQASLKIRIELNDSMLIAASYNNIGVFYYYQEDYTSALQNYNLAVKMLSQSNPKLCIRYKASYLNNIGEIYLIQQKFELASEYFNQSIEISKKLDNYYLTSMTLMNIASLYSDQKKTAKAKFLLDQSLELAKKLDNKLLIRDIYEKQAHVYNQNRELAKAIDALKKLGIVKDEIFNEQHIKAIAEMNTKYETAQKEKKITLLKFEKRRDSLLRNVSIIIAIFGVVITVMVFWAYKKIQKANLLLRGHQTQLATQFSEIQIQKETIQDINQSMTDSIVYASNIQKAFLPSFRKLEQYFPNSFIVYRPRDIVSGDFFWIKKKKKRIIFAVADCTGHGVPGAFMSMLGVSFLNEISNISDVSNAAEILEILRYKVKIALKQDGTYGSSKDGMDIALCMYNLETKGLCYAGAYNPLIIIRNNELFEYKATKSPIGIYPKEKEFENNEIQVFENDRIYMYSDGFMDQFGGENGKKYKSRNLKQLLLSISLETMDKQKIELENEFDSWMGSSYEQIDDMIIMGIKI